ncbi:signal peptidase I [Kitasatospora sp. NPDC101183]|uniref:signal peptidase I n=1 Tax=Kitasatospora sp. NPDC101183 TaxID=3364100 RepID=UPI00380A8B7F
MAKKTPGTRVRGRRAAAVLAVLGVASTALGLGVVLTGGYSVHRMAGEAMAPGLRPGDRMLAEHADPRWVLRGEVYLVDSPWDLHGRIASRVLALGGDRLVCSGGRLTLDGRPLDEPPARQAGTCREDFDVTVPLGRAFLLGDSRAAAIDSRTYAGDEHRGTVDLARLRERVVFHTGPEPPDLPGKLVGSLVLTGLGLLLSACSAATALRARRRAAAAAAPAPGPGVGEVLHDH